MIKLPCGCVKDSIRGNFLAWCLDRGWFGLFDRFHGKVTLGGDSRCV